ncbi:MAG: nickel-responsive transcriptional regulator NikR [Thiohalocapsa sp.]|nr:nickel-responsive transcriptional regulator NikR [Thiohalocapsa sp.]MCF7989136.1 nickel-responsive transcriptional regulator NikR [Thiohalocapsa sp.]
MQRMTITLDDDLVDEFERFLAARGYENRSEAVRDLIRARLEAERLDADPEGQCVANLSYVYNHHERELAGRLTRAHHHHHDLAVSTLHVHLDHDNCMETAVLRGAAARVRAFADSVIAQPGVRHGKLSILQVKVSEQNHPHDSGAQGQSHLHLKPLV